MKRSVLVVGLYFVTILLAIGCARSKKVSSCIDRDGDDYGLGKSCAGPDCNDSDPDGWREGYLYVDADGDGSGSGAAEEVCFGDLAPAGYSMAGTDCNDADPDLLLSLTGYFDRDGDGWTAGLVEELCSPSADTDYLKDEPSSPLDCDDLNPAISPAETEIYLDDIDQDCNPDNEGPAITSVSPAQPRLDEQVVITGRRFGAEGGAVYLNGLKAPVDFWTNTEIGVTIPAGAVAGALVVVDATGIISYPSEDLTLVFSKQKIRYIPDFPAAAPMIASLLGRPTLVAADIDGAYIAGPSGLAAFPAEPGKALGDFFLTTGLIPSRPAELETYGDYLLAVGDFGLRLFDKRTAPLTPSQYQVVGAEYNPPKGVSAYGAGTFHGVAVRNFEDEATGTVIAVSSFYDSAGGPPIYLLGLDEQTGYIEQLSQYDGAGMLNANDPGGLGCRADRKVIFDIAFDPINPKLYALACNDQMTLNNCCFIYDLDVSDIGEIKVNGSVRIPGINQVARDMAVHNDRLWISLRGGFDEAVYLSYKLAADALPVAAASVRSCSLLEDSYECSADSDCSDANTGWSTGIFNDGDAYCYHSRCQFCRSTREQSGIDIDEETGTVLGFSGSADDRPYVYNFHLFNYNYNGGSDDFPQAATRSAAGAIDAAISLIDSWVVEGDSGVIDIELQEYSPYIVPPSAPYPAEPGRRLWGRNSVGFPWLISQVPGRDISAPFIVSGSPSMNIYSAGAIGSIAGLDTALPIAGLVHYSGAARGDRVIVRGAAYAADPYAGGIGFYSLKIGVDSSIEVMNSPSDGGVGPFPNRTADNNTDGNVIWDRDGYALAPIGADGLKVFRVANADGSLTEAGGSGPLNTVTTLGSTTTESMGSIFKVGDNKIMAPIALRSQFFAPPTEWGGIYFYSVTYPTAAEVDVTVLKTGAFNALQGKSIYFGPSAVSASGWVAALVAEHLNSAPETNRYVVVFQLDEIDQYNEACPPVEANRTADQQLACDGIVDEIAIRAGDFSPSVNWRNIRPPAIVSADSSSSGQTVVVPVSVAEGSDDSGAGVYLFGLNSGQAGYFPGYNGLDDVDSIEAFAYHRDKSLVLLPEPQTVLAPEGGAGVYVFTRGGGSYLIQLGN